MLNCTASDVREVIHTDLTDSQIESIITTSDALITKRTGTRVSGELARRLSVLMTASTIKTRQPSSSTIGEYREEWGEAQEVWQREIEAIVRLHKGPNIAPSSYQSIDEGDRYEEAG